MSREADFSAVMLPDIPLMAILTGGVFQRGNVGEDGITRDSTPAAFDGDSYLKCCALVSERAPVPTGDIFVPRLQAASINQVVEIWVYDDHGFANIDLAIARLYKLFQGNQFSDTFELEMAAMITHQFDNGALKGRPFSRIDFAVYSVMLPTA